MADDARQAELREVLAEALYWHMTEADEARGCALRCGYDGPDRSEHLAAELLPVVSAWAEADREQHAARRAAEELGEALGKAATLGPLEAVAWMARRHVALSPATEEER